jgi:hypothetical protein
MAADIMALSNALIYRGALRCGSPAVANARLCLPNLPNLLTATPTPPAAGSSDKLDTCQLATGIQRTTFPTWVFQACATVLVCFNVSPACLLACLFVCLFTDWVMNRLR